MVLAMIPYLLIAFSSPAQQVPPVDFIDDIMPIVRAKCVSCHGGSEVSGGLDLSTPEGWIKGGVSGELLEPFKPEKSHIIERLTSENEFLKMPQGMPALPADQIKLFKDWIEQGALFDQPTFERDIKPLFIRRCSTCHQGDSPAAELNLLSRASVLEVVTPGDPENSTLIHRLKGLHGLERMPMGFKALENSEIRRVEDWIKQGAVQGKAPQIHWAYRPVVKPAVPISDSNWIKNPIDAFILTKLESEGLEPSVAASKEKLLRRLTQDLTGLPPTLAELDRFASQQETTEQAIDRLLASPRFGERMAVPWLDLARYADSNGYEKDNIRSIWKYRDWVVDAFNSNMPYDQFTIKQLAGDLLPDAAVEDLVATGFHRNTMHNLEGGVDQDEAMYQVRSDRTDTTSTVWLGQTMACARCHDHKYDPISHKEYFQFYAYFANNKFEKRGNAEISEQKYYEPFVKVPSPEQSKKLATLNQKLVAAEIKTVPGDISAEKEEWVAAYKNPKTWQPVALSTKDARMVISGNQVATPGPSPDTMSYNLSVTVPQGTRALRLRVLPDSSRAYDGPGRADSGNFILSRISLEGAKAKYVAADFVQGGYSTAGVLDNNPETGWAISGAAGRPHDFVIEFDKTVSGKIELGLHCESTRWVHHTLGKFQIDATSIEGATRFAIPEKIRAILDLSNPSSDQEATLDAHYANIAIKGREEREALASIKSQLRDLDASIPTTLVMEEADGKTEAPIRHRGEFMSPTEVVSAGTPAAFGSPSSGSRLDLANWIVDKKNPLTARVQVNRLWEMVFGRGLVETSENFGTQGSPPSHPELLDWLAATYMESGWDTKALLKLIVSSATYQQSSAVTRDRLAKDPKNDLLSRGPRFRLAAEFIRDQALAVSGLLDTKAGGPPVSPYQPDGVWNSPYSGEQWRPSKDGDATRRSIYTFWKRTASYPMFMAFDATSREQCTVRRSITNTPLQALTTLNDPGLFAAAKALGNKARAFDGSRDDQLAYLFRTVTSRKPGASELKSLASFLERTEASKGEDMAWTMVANVILNLDEALTKE
ncbi:MAG: PSD1 and planctomycete cytochrome C domain-containing protein [Fimbriimonadaceae bacterium]